MKEVFFYDLLLNLTQNAFLNRVAAQELRNRLTKQEYSTKGDLTNIVLAEIKNEIEVKLNDDESLQINRVKEAFKQYAKLQKMLENKEKDEENIQVVFAGERIALFNKTGASLFFKRSAGVRERRGSIWPGKLL